MLIEPTKIGFTESKKKLVTNQNSDFSRSGAQHVSSTKITIVSHVFNILMDWSTNLPLKIEQYLSITIYRSLSFLEPRLI